MDLTQFILSALAEDVGDGDHSSLACIPTDTKAKAKLLVKEDAILAGVELSNQIFAAVDPLLVVDYKIVDGTAVKQGDIAFFVEGNPQSILKADPYRMTKGWLMSNQFLRVMQ